MKRLLMIATFLGFAPTSFAQLTHEQKLNDFKSLVGLYNKQYAPYEWKVDAIGFDLLKLQPWLQEVNASHDDLDFYDISVRYVASLQDSHDEFILPSFYEVYLPILADLYDGHVLIDFIDRSVLPSQTYPFAVGDELISVDGKSVGDWITELGPYSANGQGNPVSRDRLAVATMLDRYQGYYPFASKIHDGDTATIVIKRQDGTSGTYNMAWQALGLPLTAEGPVPNPGAKPFRPKTADSGPAKRSMRDRGRATANSWGLWTGSPPDLETEAVPEPMKNLQKFDDFSAHGPDQVLAGGLFPFSSKFPAFSPPAGFQLRLGARSTDEFVSGTFPVGNNTVGFIRIPSFGPANTTNAVNQFRAEIAFFQQNTKGLVIDLMGNGGGNLCYSNRLVQFLSPTPFQNIAFQVRASAKRLLQFESLLAFEENNGGSQSDIDAVTSLLDEVQRAMAQERGLTQPIQALSPVVCNGAGGFTYPPATDSSGHNIAFTKPILLLTDNFSISAAEMFAALLQDQNRVSVYGVRTDGGGGNVVQYSSATGPYSEGTVRMTESIGVRNHDIKAPGLPSAPFVENIGIQPDVQAQYNTRNNLLTGGQPFVNGFSQAMGALILSGH